MLQSGSMLAAGYLFFLARLPGERRFPVATLNPIDLVGRATCYPLTNMHTDIFVAIYIYVYIYIYTYTQRTLDTMTTFATPNVKGPDLTMPRPVVHDQMGLCFF